MKSPAIYFFELSKFSHSTSPSPTLPFLPMFGWGWGRGGVGWGAGICMSSLQVCELFAMAWFSELLSLVYPEADWLVFCLKSLSDDFPVNSLNSLSFQVHICSGSGN